MDATRIGRDRSDVETHHTAIVNGAFDEQRRVVQAGQFVRAAPQDAGQFADGHRLVTCPIEKLHDRLGPMVAAAGAIHAVDDREFHFGQMEAAAHLTLVGPKNHR